MPERSDPSCNVEIARNALAPRGFGRRRSVCFVATPRRCFGIACVASPRIRSCGAPNAAIVISVAGHQFGVVGLVAARARGPVRVFLRVHLGKFRRLAHARPMAGHAETRGIEFRRLDLRVFRMSGESAVARLAGKRRVAAPLLRVGDVGMTVEARGFSGEARGADAIVRKSAGSIVPVTAEISGDEPGAHDQEREDSDSEDPRDPQEVASVSKKLPHLFRTLGGARPGETGSNASFRDEFQRASDR